MQLNKKDREEFRRRVAEKLKDVEFNPDRRIKLPKDVLDDLLFDEVILPELVSGENKKVFAYAYDGLCKLDLSCYDMHTLHNVSFDSDLRINLSDTNMKICFNSTFEFQDKVGAKFRNIDFTNVDLSEAYDLRIYKNSISFKGCTFNNTKLFINELKDAVFVDCDLSGLESLSLVNLYATDEEKLVNSSLNGSLILRNCNLSNTGAKIFVENYYKDDEYDENFAYKHLGYLISKKYLDGCYVNGSLVKSKDENKKEAEKLLEEYEKYKRERINKTIEEINEQVISSSGGRQLNLKRITENSEEENGNN